MSIRWCHSLATSEVFFDDFLIIVNFWQTRKQCPGSPRAAIPAFSPRVLVGKFPKPFLSQLRCGCAFLQNAFLKTCSFHWFFISQKQKECRSEHQRLSLMPGSAFLSFLFFPFLSIGIFLALRIIERSDILADGQILPGFAAGSPIFSELRFFLFHQLGILNIQLLYAGDLFDAKFIESFLSCLVNGEFLPVSFEELFAVSGFAVSFISRPGVRVIVDVFPQRRDLRDPLFHRLDRIAQGITLSDLLIDMCVEILPAVDPVFPQKQERLRYSLQVMDLRPACVSRSFCPELLLHIDEQADSFLPLRRPALCFSDRRIQEILPEIRFPISFRIPNCFFVPDETW